MSHSPITQLPRFPGPLSPSLAWQAWKTAAFDAAAVPIQGHLHGLLGFILTPAEYQALAGEVFAPFEHPQVFAAEANLFPIWKYEAEIFYVQCAALASFKQLLLSSLDPTAIAVVADPEGSTATATPRHILATLFAAYGSPLPEEVNSQRLSLMIPYSMEVPIRAHILHHTTVHAFLLRADAGITEVEKIFNLIASLSQCGLYTQAIAAYQRQFPTTLQQTFAALSLEIIALQLTTPTAPTAASAGYALTVGGAHSSASSTARILQLEALVATLRAPPPPKPSKQYCWTHGNTRHSSADCRSPHAGHNTMATAANKLGGK